MSTLSRRTRVLPSCQRNSSSKRCRFWGAFFYINDKLSSVYPQAPESLSQASVTLADPHALKLARLQWELARRKELSEEAESR